MGWAKLEYVWKCGTCGKEWMGPQFKLSMCPDCGVGGDVVRVEYGRELREDGVMVPVDERPTEAGVRIGKGGRSERYRVIGGVEIVEVE